jgi:hypothetical protein
LQLCSSCHGQLYFRAGGDDQRLRLAGRFVQDVTTTADVAQLFGIALLRRQALPGQHQGGGSAAVFQCRNPGLLGFDCIAGAPDRQPGNQAQAGDVFDRLMRGAVFAQTDGVVGVDMDDLCRQQGGHAHGIAP